MVAGEDMEEGENSSIKLRWPSRFPGNPTGGDHTVKEACWKVLAAMVTHEDDIRQAKEGLPIREITRRIEDMGLRSAKGSATNEGSVAGALSRDQLFFHVAPGTYALHVCPRRLVIRVNSCVLVWPICQLAYPIFIFFYLKKMLKGSKYPMNV